MRRVFADAHFYIAILNIRDAWHRTATAILAEGQFTEMVTTTPVILELADGMAGISERRRCPSFIDQIHRSNTTKIVSLDAELWVRGLDLYRARLDKQWSLTDCISFTVMADENLTDALTADRHFAQAGFRALLA